MTSVYFASRITPAKPAVAVDEVPLVAEAVRLPLELGRDRHADVEALAVEHERHRHDGFSAVYLIGVYSKRNLCFVAGAQHHLELPERLLLDAQRVDEVDVVADAARAPSLAMMMSGVGFQNAPPTSTW